MQFCTLEVVSPVVGDEGDGSMKMLRTPDDAEAMKLPGGDCKGVLGSDVADILPWTGPDMCELLDEELVSNFNTEGWDEQEVNAEGIAEADGFERPSS